MNAAMRVTFRSRRPLRSSLFRLLYATVRRMSTSSSLSEEVESMSDKLNYLKLEEVVQHLRFVKIAQLIG